ncbi:uncharacterized protein BDZ99DRAFT_531064 [Mytilinidion resinicola]|uniref:BTB domain-containing protein n=1 Tax=Mytilinidion resinicola TaxID=574789 RepID=A0A6A6ZAE5_9PEZI|nr:uncharacterized protein BDZ99DRAFT_531064 [Mytilinidion resinicola]KAF2817808.1 hypothetical protein BDZ99DRAFT_531064 [Mytilinidion resinicola]
MAEIIHERFSPDDGFSDVTLRVHYPGRESDGAFDEYKAHRVILCQQSKWFDRALKGRFLVRRCLSARFAGEALTFIKEASTQVIDIHEDEPSVFNCMLQFMYERHYKLRTVEEASAKIGPSISKQDLKTMTLDTHIDVYNMAQKYLNDDLQAFSAKQFTEAALTIRPSYPGVRTSVNKQFVEQQCSALARAVDRFYETALTTNTKMGRAIAAAAWQSTLVDRERFDELINEYPTFAVDVLLEVKKNMRPSKDHESSGDAGASVEVPTGPLNIRRINEVSLTNCSNPTPRDVAKVTRLRFRITCPTHGSKAPVEHKSQPVSAQVFCPDDTFSDVTIRVCEEDAATDRPFTEYKTHRSSANSQSGSRRRSKAVHQTLTNSWEASTNLIEILDDDPRIFDYMMCFMYEQAYEVCATSEAEEDVKAMILITHMGIYTMVQKYFNAGLHSFSVALFNKYILTLRPGFPSKSRKDQETTHMALVGVVERFYDSAIASGTTMGQAITSVLWACKELVHTEKFERLLKDYPTLRYGCGYSSKGGQLTCPRLRTR